MDGSERVVCKKKLKLRAGKASGVEETAKQGESRWRDEDKMSG